jgi:hypothetical protein
LRQQAVLIGAGVLVVLEQDGVVAGDQQAGDRVVRQVVVQRAGGAAEPVGQGDFLRGAAQGRGGVRAGDRWNGQTRS